MKIILTGLLSVLCAATAGAETGAAKIVSLDKRLSVTGTVTFTDTEGGLRVFARLTGLPPGRHGFHIHRYGSCDREGNAAGIHYNPTHAGHGLAAEDGFKHAHAGDLGNITADAKGQASYDVVIPGEKLSEGPISVAGRAVIVHEGEDKFDQPEGSAGPRIACGVIAIIGK